MDGVLLYRGHISDGPNELPSARGEAVELTLMTLPYVLANEPRYPRTKFCAV